MNQKIDIPLTDPERQALAEYILRQQRDGRTEIAMSELKIVMDTIQAVFATLPVRFQRGGK